MRLWIRAAFVLAVMGTGVAVGCGGNVVVDASGGPGSGGSGGSGGTTSNGTFTTSTSQTTSISVTSTTSTTSSSDSSSVSTSNVTVSSSSTGPSECDNSGDCGDGQVGCLGCAIQGPCADAYNNCINDSTCIEYSDCSAQCSSPTCQQKCAESFPKGMQLYEELIICAVCKACPNDCGGGPGCGGI